MTKAILCHACYGTGFDLTISRRVRCKVCGGSGLIKTANTLTRIADNPKHWQNRAEELRSLAQAMHDEGARSMMLRMARDYDDIAARVEKRIN